MTKEKYLIMAAILGICTVNISGSYVMAAENSQEVQSSEDNAYPELGNSEEEQAYREFLRSGENFSDVENLETVMYAVYNINQDKTKELIIRGMDSDYAYRYLFYEYENGQVKSAGSMKNWQNGGEGEMYYAPNNNAIVVYMRLADHKEYKLYRLKDTVEQVISMHRQSLDVQGTDGNYHREYAYSVEKPDENTKIVTENVWNKLESSLVEIPFYDFSVKTDMQVSEEQAAVLSTTPFYGIWCYGGKRQEDASAYAQSMRRSGYDAQVFVTTDWSNLNSEKFYVVTAGIYQSENDANAALNSVQSFCANAYVKYSGDYQG